jgi:S-formylglutathione hydrolase FrmB
MLLILPWSAACANALRNRPLLDRANRRLCGQVIDYTRNHGRDNRIWSPALCQKRDLYVYLPPGYDPCRRYPLVLWLHGFAQDEVSFLRDVIPRLDRAIVCGELPPVIIAAPDGSLHGHACLFSAGSFFLNTKAGAFEDYLMCDVWNFLHEHYSIRPEREAHALAGVSMGGGAAFNKAIKYRERFKIALGIFPPLNTRWVDCKGRYRGNFDPCCWGWRTDFSRRREVVARFYGLVTIRMGQLIRPLYGRSSETLAEVSRENPIEMLDAYDVREGQLSMFVAYGAKDQFNLDAQIESFLYVACHRGLTVTVLHDPKGKHNRRTALSFVSPAIAWLAPQLAPYSPSLAPDPCRPGR